MGLFSNNMDKVQCNKCNSNFKVTKVTHIDGITYCKDCAVVVIKLKEKKRAQVTPEQIKNIIITTTSSLPDREIEEYFDPISSQVVMGVDILKDIMASFRSAWGGRSKGLERELNSGYAFAIEDIKKEAFLMGADAVIGTRITSSLEMAGESGKSNDKMVVISGVGTPVKLRQ